MGFQKLKLFSQVLDWVCYKVTYAHIWGNLYKQSRVLELENFKEVLSEYTASS